MKAIRLAALAWLLLGSPALAGGTESQSASQAPLDAQPLIDACRSGVDLDDQRVSVETRREAASEVVKCHEAAILRLMESMYDPDMFSRDDARKLLADVSTPLGRFYYYLFARHRGCECEADGWISYDVAVAKRYEALLREMVSIHNSYGY